MCPPASAVRPIARQLPLGAVLVLLVACAGPRPGPPATPGGGGRALQGWADGAVFYEVFVRSFQDSDGDGKGDLRGLVSRLDYLNDGDPATTTDLGADALWLMPVFASPSYHGYDTTDYETINPDYGTNADFSLLCAEAHKRGMRIVIDLVLNHTSSSHPWFVESSSAPSSPRRDWYVWSPANPGWTQPWNPASPTWHPKNGAWFYGLFWAGMPDLDFRTHAVREEAKRIASLWLERGADGFRLDASRHLVEDGPGPGQSDTPETHRYWKEFAAHVRGVRPDAILIGENWTETPVIAAYYGSTDAVPGGDELPLNFDFPLARRIVEGVSAGDATGIGEKLLEVQRTYPAGATDAPFLTNHDQRRVASELRNDPGRLRSAAAILLTLPGAPFLYYGEEIGLENGAEEGDEAKRTPMPWDATPGGGFTSGRPWHRFAPGRERTNVAAQAGDPGSLLSHYRDLVRARHASPALARGRLELLSSGGPLLVFLRARGDERVLVAHNLGDEPASAPVHVEAGGAAPLFASRGATIAPALAGWIVSLPPRGSAAFHLR